MELKGSKVQVYALEKKYKEVESNSASLTSEVEKLKGLLKESGIRKLQDTLESKAKEIQKERDLGLEVLLILKKIYKEIGKK